MPEIKVTVVHAAESAERTVTTGTRAWELFADKPTVIRTVRGIGYQAVTPD